MNRAHAIEITKACTVTFMKARNYLILRCTEKRANQEKRKTGENIFVEPPISCVKEKNILWTTFY